MTDKQRRMTDSVMSKIIDSLPPSRDRDTAAKALENMPGLSIKGNVTQMAITLSGPIHFAPVTGAERRP